MALGKEKIINTALDLVKSESKLKCALQIHVFYPELLEDILSRLAINEIDCDLLVSVPSEKVARHVSGLLTSYDKGEVLIRVTPNKGRNFGPLLTEFSEQVFKYDVIGHVHTKKSEALLENSSYANSSKIMVDDWRTLLLENTIGGINRSAKIILNAFEADTKLGIVFPFDPHYIGWTENKSLALDLAQRMNIGHIPEELISFPMGSMFWARPEALSPLFKLNLNWDDYPGEPLAYDGTMLHAIERLLPIISQSQGYDYAMNYTPGINR